MSGRVNCGAAAAAAAGVQATLYDAYPELM